MVRMFYYNPNDIYFNVFVLFEIVHHAFVSTFIIPFEVRLVLGHSFLPKNYHLVANYMQV